jgi:hypothetical protein
VGDTRELRRRPGSASRRAQRTDHAVSTTSAKVDDAATSSDDLPDGVARAVVPAPMTTKTGVYPLAYEPMLDTPTAARFLGLKASTLNGWRSEGRGPAYCRLGGNAIRYRLTDLKRFVESSVVQTNEALLAQVGR